MALELFGILVNIPFGYGSFDIISTYHRAHLVSLVSDALAEGLQVSASLPVCQEKNRISTCLSACICGGEGSLSLFVYLSLTRARAHTHQHCR